MIDLIHNIQSYESGLLSVLFPLTSARSPNTIIRPILFKMSDKHIDFSALQLFLLL